MNQYKHINQSERELIFSYLSHGKSYREIGKLMSRDHRSIGREVQRNRSNKVTIYSPSVAHKIASTRRKKALLGKLSDPSLQAFIIRKLSIYWSPEQISGRLKLKAPGSIVSAEAIYQFIYHSKNRKLKLWDFLRRRHSKRQLFNNRKVKRQLQIPNRMPIEVRPEQALLRSEIGHWETDNMEGKQGTGGHVSVLVDRKSRLVYLDKLVSKRPVEKAVSITNQFGSWRQILVKTITMDNGTENFYHATVAQKLNCYTYFCHPYHAWEKGTVENTIGLVRQYLPKGYDLSQITRKGLNEIAAELNHRPRKILQFKTPAEVFNNEIHWGTSR